MKFLIDNSNDGYGNFIEMAALITTESTFVFSDSRNTEFFSHIDFGSYKGRGTMLGNKSFFDGQQILAQVHTHNEFSEIESSGDFSTSALLKVPVYAIDLATRMIGRGIDFRGIENVNGSKYGSTNKVGSIEELLNGNFNIRNNAKDLLLRAGF